MGSPGAPPKQWYPSPSPVGNRLWLPAQKRVSFTAAQVQRPSPLGDTFQGTMLREVVPPRLYLCTQLMSLLSQTIPAAAPGPPPTCLILLALQPAHGS